MTELKGLPKHFAIKRNIHSPLWNKYIDWLNELDKSEEIITGHESYEYYGRDKTGFGFGEIENFSGNTKVITLEQWDAIVNKKEETMASNPYEMTAKMMNEEETYSLNNGIGTETVMSSTKQPKLKVGDKIPEYLDGKLRFGTPNGELNMKNFTVFGDTKIIRIENNRYLLSFNGRANWTVSISEVDALIEQHERERKEPDEDEELPDDIKEWVEELKLGKNNSASEEWVPCKSEMGIELIRITNEMMDIYNTIKQQKENEQKGWIPKVGEEVEVECGGKWYDLHFYIGKKGRGTGTHIVENKNGIIREHFNIRQIKFIRKTHSEIAEILGISKEQLKIVEG